MGYMWKTGAWLSTGIIRGLPLMTALLALALVAVPAYAWVGPDPSDVVFASNETCFDSLTLNRTVAYSSYSNCCDVKTGDCNTTTCVSTVSQLISCQYGCHAGACFPGSFLSEYTFAVLLAIALSFMFVGYIWKYPALVIMGSVFMLLVAVILLTEGLVIAGVLYTVANTVMITYFALILILTAVFTIGTSLFG